MGTKTKTFAFRFMFDTMQDAMVAIKKYLRGDVGISYAVKHFTDAFNACAEAELEMYQVERLIGAVRMLRRLSDDLPWGQSPSDKTILRLWEYVIWGDDNFNTIREKINAEIGKAIDAAYLVEQLSEKGNAYKWPKKISAMHGLAVINAKTQRENLWKYGIYWNANELRDAICDLGYEGAIDRLSV